MKQRKIPMRKCVACQENKEKKALIRVVRSPEGIVSVDPTGRANGRGAYLCLDLSCIDLSESKNLLGKQLKATVDSSVYTSLREMAGDR
ncbi:YlxR family protein [Pullulanibacillus sp. KACC 23026]|uniref:RNase P modulator RnpM n=1 Tax=Pullulanibacillus sp. KACC 23026 TaxID=3028315 RepID=UPI0023B0871C|nr:YlxR family protein [Pullulanibacillus sp. KACC 23026]WEG11583.1 YlxR family protein [Pullulanibacillus sp. KACC 23026]